jgi:probable F420-dependent oxidoreductase
VKLGYFGIGSGPCGDPEVAMRVARSAEDAGFESVWTGEHIVLPDPRVPPSPAPPRFPMLHPSTILSYLAGVTSTLRLGTGIVILPQRNPLVLAKELASVDVVSKGRLEFGLGVGYLKPEFDALGVPFSDKGARADEYIDAIRALWTQEKPEFHGRFVDFAGIDAHPRPAQQPHPPIVVGGHSSGAHRRAVSRGNGWYGFALDVDATQKQLVGLREAEQQAGRPSELGTLEISVTPGVPLDRDTVRRYQDLGVDRLIPLSTERTADGLVDFIERAGALVR